MFRFVSFRFKAKENPKRCGGVFFDVLPITSPAQSAKQAFGLRRRATPIPRNTPTTQASNYQATETAQSAK